MAAWPLTFSRALNEFLKLIWNSHQLFVMSYRLISHCDNFGRDFYYTIHSIEKRSRFISETLLPCLLKNRS